MHLAVDGIGALGADLQLILDPGVGELALQRLDELGRDPLAVLLRGQTTVALLVDVRRGEILTDSELLIRSLYPLLHATTA